MLDTHNYFVYKGNNFLKAWSIFKGGLPLEAEDNTVFCPPPDRPKKNLAIKPPDVKIHTRSGGSY